MPLKQNRPWTEEEDRRLLQLKAAGRSAISIAVALKRSTGGVEGRLSVMRAKRKAAEDSSVDE